MWKGAMIAIAMTAYDECVCVVETQNGQIAFPHHGPTAEGADMRNEEKERYSPKPLAYAEAGWELMTQLPAAGLGLLNHFPLERATGAKDQERLPLHGTMGSPG